MSTNKPRLMILTDDKRNIILLLRVNNYDENIKPTIRAAVQDYRKVIEFAPSTEWTDFIANELLKSGYDVDILHLNDAGYIIDVLDYEVYHNGD